MADSDEPAERCRHSTVLIDDFLYLWGGWQKNLPKVHSSHEKERLTSHVHAFHCKHGEWTRHGTIGHPPLGVSHYACAAIDRTIFYFAGYCGHGKCDHNSLTALNLDDFSWRTLFHTSDDHGPMKKSGCGLIAFNGQLLAVGGVSYSAPTTPKNPPFSYEKLKSFFYTNEHHLFDTEGAKWNIPVITGEMPRPTSDFTFTKISAEQGVMFGGYGPTGFSSTLRVATVRKGRVDWEEVPRSGPDWPMERSVHAAACFIMSEKGTPGQHLMILGGSRVGDGWMCDVKNWLWKKVANIPDILMDRWYHSIAAVGAGENCVWMMVVGGLKSTSLSKYALPVVAMLELKRNPSGQWNSKVRLQRDIYDGYREKFSQTFLYKPMLEESERQVVQLQKQLPRIRSEMTELQASLKKKEDELDMVKRISRGKDTQIQKLERDVQLQLKHSEKTMSEKKKLEEEVQILQGLCRTKDEHIEECEAIIKQGEQMAEEVTCLKQKLESIKKPSFIEDTEVEQQIKEKDEYIYRLKETIEMAEVKITKYEAVNKEKDGEVTRLKQELEKAKRPPPLMGPPSTHDSATQVYSPETEASLDSSSRAAVQDAYVQADYLALNDDCMLAAEVLAETVLEVTGDGHQTLSWSNHGFRLTVPAGAVPPGATISLAIKSILSGEFELPDGCQLVSAIYWIKASQPFNKNVILHLLHCGVIESEEHYSRYKFVAGKCSQPNLPYKLVPRDGGDFTHDTHEASISVKQFSFYAVVSEGSDMVYMGQAFYRPVERTYVWKFDYVITKYIPSLVEDVQEEYEKGQWTKHHDQFLEFEEPDDGSEESITLSVERGSQDDKWEIKPIASKKITKRRVDRMLRKTNPPHCLMAVTWTGELRSMFPRVSREVELEGAKDPDHYFSIQLPDKECSILSPSADVADRPAHNSPAAAILSTNPPVQAPLIEVPAVSNASLAATSSASVPTPLQRNGVLDEDDLEAVVAAVIDIADAERLGLKLGIRLSALDKIKVDYPKLEGQKTRIVHCWLKRNDVVRARQSEHPTWDALADAVASLDCSLSERIRVQYC